MEEETSLYKELVTLGVEISNHESDLYFEATQDSLALLDKYPNEKKISIRFKSQANGKPTVEIPFGYEPFWEKVNRASKECHDVLTKPIQN